MLHDRHVINRKYAAQPKSYVLSKTTNSYYGESLEGGHMMSQMTCQKVSEAQLGKDTS